MDRSLFPTSFGSRKGLFGSTQTQAQVKKKTPAWVSGAAAAAGGGLGDDDDGDDDDNVPRLTRPPEMDAAKMATETEGATSEKKAPVFSFQPRKDVKGKGLDTALHPLLQKQAQPRSIQASKSVGVSKVVDEGDEVDDEDGDDSGKTRRPDDTVEDAAEEDEDEDEDDEIGPRPATASGENDHDDEEDDHDDDDDGGYGDLDVIPVTEEIRLADHRRTVSALALDPAGSRIITGGRDCTVKMWDFNGMDTRFRPFRTINEPCGGNPIRELQYSVTGDSFLIAASTMQIKLYNREGAQIQEYMKGDPYIRDMKHTKGHVAALTGCRWHPSDRDKFISSSLDGTVRVWDVNNKRENLSVIFNKSKVRGGRTGITALSYTPDGNIIACGGQDGELRIWAAGGPFIKPTHSVENAHVADSPISCINFSIDNHTMITRCMDDTLKLWDLRKIQKPVVTVSSLPNMFEESNCIFSPSDRLVITGTSARRGDAKGAGKLLFYDKTSLEPVKSVDVQGSVVRVLWHGRINQILVSTSEGAVSVFYDQSVSASGAKLCAGKAGRRVAIDGMANSQDDSNRVIINPHALPMFREEFHQKTKRKAAKIRNDPVATRRPDRPLTGPGRGGKVGSSAQQVLLKTIMRDTMRDEDPREAILRHAEAAEKDPMWIAPAYKKSQPVAVLSERVFEDEVEEARATKKRRPL